MQLGAGLTDRDLDFIVDHAAPGSGSRDGLKRLIVEDDDFRKAMVGDDRVFLAVTSDDEILLKLSPHLYFEVLLRRAHSDIDSATHTLERTGRERVPVFDAREVSTLLSRDTVLVYLADMLASCTRVHSYVVPIRRRRGIRRKIRYSDMDIDSLIGMCASADEDSRFAFYKRIADLCLFITGVFQGRGLDRRTGRGPALHHIAVAPGPSAASRTMSKRASASMAFRKSTPRPGPWAWRTYSDCCAKSSTPPGSR